MRPRKRKGEICSSDLGHRKQDEPWVDRYTPCSKVDLAVHKKKVEEVENWLKVHTDGSQGGLLLLTGPSGCGKTATIQVLSLELGLRIQEWTNPPKLDSYTNSQQDRTTNSLSSTSQSAQFQEFLLRANKYNCLKMVGDARSTGMNLILVEEFPNQFYRNPSGLHDILRCFVKTSRFPLVFIVSNSPSADSSSRFLFPRELMEELHISNISFNPVAPTTMMKVLTRILTNEDGKSNGRVIVPDQTVLEMVCSGSSGDIRSAINNLQFASVPDYPQQKEALRGNHPLKSKVMAVSRSTLRKKSKPKNGQEGQPPVGMKDTCLFLFRALGKILHCKRGTPECIQEAECAFALQLPSHLSQHHRESLQVDPEWVIEHSYVSGEFFNLYLHQNYLDFFSEMEDVEKASEYMSDADLLTSDWMSSNTMREYASSVATRGLLHSNSQQIAVGFRPLHKPNWLLVSKKHRENCLAAQFLFRHFCMTPVSLQTELLPYLAKFTNPFKNQEFGLMLMPHLHQAISLDDDLVTGDLGDGMTVRTTSLSTRKKSQSSTEPRGPISPDGDVYRRSHAREAACMPRLMTEGWEKMSTWKMPLIGNAGSFADMPKEELRDKLLESIEVIDVLICELEVAHRYLEGKFEALKILQGKAILEQATSHTKSLLQKSEERAKDLEKEVNSLQWELSLNKLQMKTSERLWEQRCSRILTENKMLTQKLEEREKEPLCLQAENSVLRRQCLELFSMLNTKEQRTHSQYRDARVLELRASETHFLSPHKKTKEVVDPAGESLPLLLLAGQGKCRSCREQMDDFGWHRADWDNPTSQ
ncbi:cell cycle checkpoint protein RAD17 isoform X1 [Hippocampus comes]|uniref:cell cycle checkpoint protein RAD17 isoform X1 n=2 Tax=Hippocampus comes TaxID=109280 RepID=UPI00094EB500|nr:PREDICTED: cell cycle checkpoint protein RAD17 isoform X1 [Hippocampus comes]XP_019716432.1 PREDICTED: cell cycle checkpoint protein RAD17 isoform X1 [Hippocampus comes]